MEAAYMVLPQEAQGKSVARMLEARMIQALQDRAFPLLSAHDKRNRTVPSGKAA